MNTDTGRIYDQKDLKALQNEDDGLHKALTEAWEGDKLVEVKEEDMTDKQKETKQVSLKDHTSKLGKQLTEARKHPIIHRGDPCGCGSGKIFKKCCQHIKKMERTW